jgi:hypothetical protein
MITTTQLDPTLRDTTIGEWRVVEATDIATVHASITHATATGSTGATQRDIDSDGNVTHLATVTRVH